MNKKVNVVRQLHWKQIVKSYKMKVLSKHLGKYNNCADVSAFMVWILMGGHMRTLTRNMGKIKSSMDSINHCHFIGIVSRKYVARYSWGHSMKISPTEFNELRKINTSDVCRQLSSTHENLACETTERYPKRAWGHLDTMYEGFSLLNQIHNFHDIRKQKNDIIVFTRPDVLTNPFDA